MSDPVASPEDQLSDNDLDEDKPENKLLEAAQLTFIFNKKEKGQFFNIFKPSETISRKFKIEKWQDLIQFYENWFKQNTKSLPNLPNREELGKKYFEKALKLAQQSYQADRFRYVNPITLTVNSADSLEELNNIFNDKVTKNIKEYIHNIQSLPILNEKGWKTVFEEIYTVKDKPALSESESVSVELKLEPNSVYPADTHEEKKIIDMDVENENKNTIFTKQIQKGVQMQVKPYDILRMRDYLRILRRFWNLSRLHGGKEITTFDENWEVKNNPYLKNHPLKENINKRCQQTIVRKRIKREMENN